MSARSFSSCAVIAPREAETRNVVRALHEAGFAVLQREADASVVRLVATGEIDLVVCWCPGDAQALRPFVPLGRPLIAVLVEAAPAVVASCLEAGADACIDAEAPAEVIAAQARAIMRRSGASSAPLADALGILQIGDLTVDSNRCEVERDGVYVPLTASEFRIVEHMARYAGRVLAPHEILNAVTADYEYLPREALDVFKVYVRRIRRKLEPMEDEPRYLVTVRGLGYRLEGGAITRQRPAHTQIA